MTSRSYTKSCRNRVDIERKFDYRNETNDNKLSLKTHFIMSKKFMSVTLSKCVTSHPLYSRSTF